MPKTEDQAKGKWLICDYCGEVFDRSRPSKTAGCCCKSHARLLDAERRKVTNAQRVDELKQAVWAAIDKFVKG